MEGFMDDFAGRYTIKIHKVFNNDPNDQSYEILVELLYGGKVVSSDSVRIDP